MCHMRQYLLPKDGHFYKANLHSHTTVSDGTFTAAEMKKIYMEHGYSIIAYTDHEILADHSELSDAHFLPSPVMSSPSMNAATNPGHKNRPAISIFMPVIHTTRRRFVSTQNNTTSVEKMSMEKSSTSESLIFESIRPHVSTTSFAPRGKTAFSSLIIIRTGHERIHATI